MAAFCLLIHKHGRGGIFEHLGTCLRTSIGQSLLGIVHNELFTKGIDKIFGAPGDDKFIGLGACEAHGVANDITPQATTRGDEHGVVDACPYPFQGNDGGMLASKLAHGDKFVEHIVVDHQQKALVRGVALYAKEALTGVIGLHIAHIGVGDELLVLRTIGRESYSSMKEYFQIGPHFLQMLLARKFHYAYQNTEHPARHTREVRDIFVQTLVGYAVAFQFEIAQQCRLFLWHPHEIG